MKNDNIKRRLASIILLVIIFWSASCDKKDDKHFKEMYSFLEEEEIILGGGANDTTIIVNGRFNENCYWLFAYDDVTEDSTVVYHPNESEKIQSNWFTITAKENKVNICTGKNMEDHERQVRLVFQHHGIVALIVKQKRY